MIHSRKLLAGFAAVCAALTASCNTAVVNPNHAVAYLVTGTASQAIVSYTTVTGLKEQATVELPWKYEFFTKSGSMVYVSASPANGRGVLQVQITSDGKTVFHNESDSAKTIAVGIGGNLP